MTSLIDTGFMLAVLSRNDPHHLACRAVVQTESNPLMPSAVLPELAYMVLRDLGYTPFIRFMRQLLQNESQLVIVTEADLSRATEIMEKYADSRIDFVDCVITAMAERLHISRILTIDQRHFRLLRPSHIPAFDILP
jgi:predicted nucleic acid-binding protein